MATETKIDRDASRQILDAIRSIVHELRVASRFSEKRVGLSMAQLFVLNRLAEGKAMSLNELAARTLTHQSSVSVVVQRLIASGLVDSQVSQFDKRRVELRITEKGRRVLAKAPTAAQDRMIDALKKMPADRRKQLADGLNELVDLAGLARPFPGLFMEEDAAGIGAHRAGKNQKRVN